MSKKKDSGNRFDALLGAARQQEQTPPPIEPKLTKKSKSTDPDYVRTTVYLPKRLHKQLKVAAADEEREMSEILEGLVEQWLKKRGNSDV
jgi:hypothetical protein